MSTMTLFVPDNLDLDPLLNPAAKYPFCLDPYNHTIKKKNTPISMIEMMRKTKGIYVFQVSLTQQIFLKLESKLSQKAPITMILKNKIVRRLIKATMDMEDLVPTDDQKSPDAPVKITVNQNNLKIQLNTKTQLQLTCLTAIAKPNSKSSMQYQFKLQNTRYNFNYKTVVNCFVYSSVHPYRGAPIESPKRVDMLHCPNVYQLTVKPYWALAIAKGWKTIENKTYAISSVMRNDINAGAVVLITCSAKDYPIRMLHRLYADARVPSLLSMDVLHVEQDVKMLTKQIDAITKPLQGRIVAACTIHTMYDMSDPAQKTEALAMDRLFVSFPVTTRYGWHLTQVVSLAKHDIQIKGTEQPRKVEDEELLQQVRTALKTETNDAASSEKQREMKIRLDTLNTVKTKALKSLVIQSIGNIWTNNITPDSSSDHISSILEKMQRQLEALKSLEGDIGNDDNHNTNHNVDNSNLAVETITLCEICSQPNPYNMCDVCQRNFQAEIRDILRELY
eukprot:999306_1